MDDKKIHIDELYRSKLGNHAEQPDAAVWESIANRLDNQPKVPAAFNWSKWLFRTGMALLIGGAVYFTASQMFNNQPTTHSLINNNTLAENNTAGSSTASTNNNVAAITPAADNIAEKTEKTTTTVNKQTASKPLNSPSADSRPLDAQTVNSASTKATTASQQKVLADAITSANNIPVATTKNKASKRLKQTKAIAYAGHASNVAAPKTKSKNKNTAQETNTITPPVYTYTPPVPASAPAKRWHAPRFDPNSTGPQAANAVALSYTQPPLQSAPAQAAAPVNNVAAPATITNPDEKNMRKAMPFSFNYGAKAGYEFAQGEYHANSYVVSPYVQFNLTNKLSLVLQPGIKMSTINKTYLDGGQTYYNITSAELDSNHQKIQTSIDTMSNAIYGAIKPKYYYTQTHDSIVTSTAIGKKTYFEFELPVLVQYEVVKHLRVYGGVSANFSKIVEVTEQREEYKNITLKDSLILKPQATTTASVIPSPYNKFSYTYMPYSQYNPASAQNPGSSPVRFSYMLGFNYQFYRRFSIDVLMQGSLSNQNYIYDSRVRSIYQQTHFRISLGYQFGK